MNDAVLDFSPGVKAFNRLREAFKAVDTGNQDVLDAAVMQIGEDAEPVMGAFLIGQVKTEQLLLALDIQAENGVNGLADIAAMLFDLVVNGIEPDNRIDGIQIALTPGLKLG